MLILAPEARGASANPLADAHDAEDPRGWRAEPPNTPNSVSRRDCVGFALRYRVRLMAAGIPAEDMTLMNVPFRDGRHAVLVVRYGGDMWKLDQTETAPVRWSRPDGRFSPLYTGFPIPEWAPAWWRWQ